MTDESTETGLRLALTKVGLTVRDDVDVANRANGFSRGTPLLVGFEAEIASAEGGIRLFVAQADHPRYGEEVPVWTHISNENGQSIVGANAHAPLLANADYVVIATRDLVTSEGGALEPERATLLALGLADPDGDEESARVAYHAPTRTALAQAGVDVATILVVWEFTTRSQNDPTRELRTLMAQAQAAVAAGEVSVTITRAVLNETDGAAIAIEGVLEGLPYFLLEDGALAAFTPAEGETPASVAITGTTSAPFRALIPAGTDDYRIVMYGHGTGGKFDDNTLDGEISVLGVAKIGIGFRGWGGTVAETWIRFAAMFRGAHLSTSGLMQSLADTAGIQAALDTVIGDALAAPSFTVNDEGTGDEIVVDNPAAGRRPDISLPIWTGGSLGGTMGLTYVSAHPDVRHGVLNVPGAAWTQWIHAAGSYGVISLLHKENFGGALDLLLAIKMVQTLFDPIDGVAFSDHLRDKEAVVLVQESIGDTILPNPGSRMVAACADAVQIGGVIETAVGIEPGSPPSTKSGYTQFRAPNDWEGLQRHGFANKDAEVGEAGRQQIRAYLASVLAGAAEIALPPLCQARGDICDFNTP